MKTMPTWSSGKAYERASRARQHLSGQPPARPPDQEHPDGKTMLGLGYTDPHVGRRNFRRSAQRCWSSAVSDYSAVAEARRRVSIGQMLPSRTRIDGGSQLAVFRRRRATGASRRLRLGMGFNMDMRLGAAIAAGSIRAGAARPTSFSVSAITAAR